MFGAHRQKNFTHRHLQKSLLHSQVGLTSCLSNCGSALRSVFFLHTWSEFQAVHRNAQQYFCVRYLIFRDHFPGGSVQKPVLKQVLWVSEFFFSQDTPFIFMS